MEYTKEEMEGMHLSARDREILHMAGVAYKTEKYWYAHLRGRWYFLEPGYPMGDDIGYRLQEKPASDIPPLIKQRILS